MLYRLGEINLLKRMPSEKRSDSSVSRDANLTQDVAYYYEAEVGGCLRIVKTYRSEEVVQRSAVVSTVVAS